MADIFDYIDWRGDLSFENVPPAEPDYLIFSALSYVEMNGLYTPEEEEGITVRQLYERYEAAGYAQAWMHFEPKRILAKAAESERFGNVRVCRYREKNDEATSMQFAAMTFIPRSGLYCVAFRGTDDSFTGWREDFYIACMDRVQAQQEAVRYLEDIAGSGGETLVLCGHSKGGHLAMYADMHAEDPVRSRVKALYVFDSPGFRRETAEGERILQTGEKTFRYLPDTSVVGLLMFDPVAYITVASKAAAGSTHNPYNWQVMGSHLVREEKLTAVSEYLDTVLDQWLDAVPDEERLRFINMLFDAVDASGVAFGDLEKNPLKAYPAILSALNDIDPQMKEEALDIIGRLANAGKEVLIGNVTEAIRERFKNS